MIFHPTPVTGAHLIEQEPHADERGSFARIFCAETFAAQGLFDEVTQSSVSRNARAGTLRGLHFQREPHEEAKLVRCTRGAIFDVVADLRRGSPSFGAWYGAELTADNGSMLYVPAGCAHGFQTLEDESDVDYAISVPFVAELADGVRWDDPELAVDWPQAPPQGRIISERDGALPLLGEHPSLPAGGG